MVRGLRLGQRALWLVPLAFMTMMAGGGALGMARVELPLVEVGIGVSVVILGLGLPLNGLNEGAARHTARIGGVALSPRASRLRRARVLRRGRGAGTSAAPSAT